MNLVDDDLHLVLTYVAAANRAGAALTEEQLSMYAVSPTPRRRRGGFSSWALRESLSNLLDNVEVRPAESPVAFLLRVGWIEVRGASVHLTALGRAVLAHADRPPIETSDDPLSVTIDPDDPLAYIRIFDAMSAYGTGLLVDPYVGFAELPDLAEISDVDRVLTSDRSAKRRLEFLARAVGTVDGAPEVRTVAASDLHDRYFIPDDGPVFALGSSLNSITRRPGVVTPITDVAAASAMRSAYAELWDRGAALPGTSGVEDVAGAAS